MNETEDVFAGAERVPEPTGSPYLSFELQSELDRLRTEDHPWQAGRNAKTLVKYPDLRVLLIGFRPGTHMAEHKAAGSISVQVLKGHIVFQAAGRSFDLRGGQFLTLERGIPHSLEALAESAVLVTIAWPADKA